MQFKSNLIYIFVYLFVFRGIDSQNGDQMEVGSHEVYKDLKCYYPKISSMTKLRDNKYFISTNGQKFWLISDSDGATDQNSRDLKTITTEWTKIDASLYMGLNVECGHQFRDKLILVNFNDKTQRNELIVGSIIEWKWTQMVWSDFSAFDVSSVHIDWTKSIDDIAVIEETLIIFQNQKQIRVDCHYTNKWVYWADSDYREVPISGPIDAVYFDDKSKDTFPLYAIRDNIYFICYVKEKNEEFPTCEYFPLIENSMAPQPSCFIDIDPNEYLLNSMLFQMLILLILVMALIIFSVLYLWNLWYDSKQSTTQEIGTHIQNKESEKLDQKESKTTSKTN